jgi:maleylpyruvate isomerase
MVRTLLVVLHYPSVRAPERDIEAVRQSTSRLLRTVNELTDAQMHEPCLLPGWSRAELVTHLARNADGFRGMAEAIARGEIGVMYPGGVEQRAADIAAGRGERASTLTADLRRSVDALADAWRQHPVDAWDREGKLISGTRTIRDSVFMRLRELELHHVDLGLDYDSNEWPIAFVSRTLDDTVRTLPARAKARRVDVSGRYRIEATDHGAFWDVVIDRDDVTVLDADPHVAADAVVSGWGCDLLAWLTGRRASAGTVTVSGDDVGALRLPTWFPFP